MVARQTLDLLVGVQILPGEKFPDSEKSSTCKNSVLRGLIGGFETERRPGKGESL